MLFHITTVFAILLQYGWYAEAQSSCAETNHNAFEEECGTLSISLISDLSGGRQALLEEMPWQAAVYTKLSTPFMQICGGTLVSKQVVISAAHCFWNDLQLQLPAADFALAVGKLYRPWNDKMDTNAQKSDIKQIRIPPRYHGITTNFQDDIALLVAASPFHFNANVQPICLNFDYSLDRKQLMDGNMGKVAGWGRTDANGKASPTLQVVNLPSVDIQRCFDVIEPIFRPAITSDKICAGNNTKGTAVCMGDSGGGLFFPENSSAGDTRFYLRGVVSTAPKSINEDLCNIYSYATFTHVIKHEHFIREVMAEASSMLVSNQTPSIAIDEVGDDDEVDQSNEGVDPLSLPVSNQQTSIKTIPNELPAEKPQAPDELDKYNKKLPENKHREPIPITGIFSNPDSDADYTVKIIEEPFIEEGSNSSDAQTVKIIEEPFIKEDSSSSGAQTIKILEEPPMTAVVRPTTKTEAVTEKEPYLSKVPRPYVSTEVNRDDFTEIKANQSNGIQSSESIRNPPAASIAQSSSSINKPAQSVGVVSGQSTGIQPVKPIENQPAQIIGAEFMGIQPVKTIEVQPDPLVNEPAQAIGVQSSHSLPSIGNQPAQSIGTQPVISIGNQPSKTNLPSQPIVIQLGQSVENQPIKSKDQESIGYPHALSLEIPGQAGSQPHLSTGASPSVQILQSHTAQANPHQHYHHKWNSNAFDYQYHDYPHDYSHYPHGNWNPHGYKYEHGHDYQNGNQHEGYYQSPQYQQNHDTWHH